MPDVNDLQQLLRNGPLPAREILLRLNISQPTLSRWAAEAGESLVRYGRARQSAYALRRRVAGQAAFPLYQITATGQMLALGEILPVEHQGYVVRWGETALAARQSTYSAGLPWWLEDMRSQGFLGRVFVQQYAARFGLPQDLTLWQDDHVLTALARVGEDCSGNFIVGDGALSRFLNQSPVAPIPVSERAICYPLLAQQALGNEIIGSSAGGEQPKFSALINHAESIHVLVKFTAPEDNAVTRRWRSLLLAEHLALQTLAAAGLPAASTDYLAVGQQSFLEARRFDRTPASLRGRHGLVSLAALDHAFVGQADAAWPVIAAQLERAGSITAADAMQVQRLYAFGRLIGNSDMHLGNLSFFHQQMTDLRLAPVYDMLPMQFAPRASGLIPQEVPDIRFTTPPPLSCWQEMLPLAQAYWQQVADAAQPDESFRQVAERWLQRLQALATRLG